MNEAYKFTGHTIRRATADQLVFLQTESSQYYVASGIGLDICRQIEAGVSLREIIDYICANYDTDASTASKDVTAFLRSLQSAGIIVRTVTS
jgi:hypothetical protein